MLFCIGGIFIKKEIDFNYICEKLLHLASEYGHIPTKAIIDKTVDLPRVDTVRKVFKQNGYNSYTDYLIENGYNIKYAVSPFDKYSLNDLIDLWESYHKINGKYPMATDCVKDSKLPNWSRVKIICGDDFNSFYEKYGNGKNVMTKSYEDYCNLFIQKCTELGRTLTTQDIHSNEFGIPSTRWLVKNCPDTNVKTYDDFINYLGLKAYYNVSMEYARKQILIKYHSLERPLKIDDFKNPIGEDVGIGTITRIWGTFNNMLKDLNLSINQDGMSEKHRDITQLKDDIVKLCNYIYSTEKRNIITRDDVRSCEWCLSPQTYDRWFKIELGLTLNGYIESIGFFSNKAGMGMLFKFEDGEVTTSKFEYRTTIYFRKHKVNYKRNVRYNEFIDSYNGNKDCDYVIRYKDRLFYIEVAGMLDYTKVNKDDKIRTKYKKDLNEKIEMLVNSNLNHLIVYPSDFQTKSLDEIFSFLHT